MKLSFRERSPLLVGIASILLISLGVGLAFSVNRFDFIKGVYPIHADLRDAAGLQPGNEVRVAGVKVGTVTKIVLTEESARIEMEVQNDVQVPVETRLEVKLKTLLGQKFVDLQMPKAFLEASKAGRDPTTATAGFFVAGDVIPIEQTRIPYEIYQAAQQGTAKLARLDKKALRKMLNVLGDTLGASKDELGRLVISLDSAGSVLVDKSPGISRLLKNVKKVSGTLAASDQDLDAILLRSSEVFGTLADRRATTSSLLAATNDLTKNLGLLLQVARGSINSSVTDLNVLLRVINREYASISTTLDQFAATQELFGRPLTFGRFVEGHVCAITTEDVCVPWGTPEDPKVPVKGTQPSPTPVGSGPMRSRLVSIFVTLAIVAGGAFYLTSSGTPTYTITADVEQAPNLFEGGRVMVRGVEVGTITTVEPGPASVRVTMEIDEDVKLPEDAFLGIVPITVIADRYVQISPPYESGPTLADGANIPVDRTQIPAELDDVLTQLQGLLSALEPKEGESEGPLARLITGLDDAFDGKGEELARALDSSSTVLQNLADADRDITGLIQNLDTFFLALANRASEIGLVNERLQLVTEALVGDQENLEGTIENLAFFADEAAKLVGESGDELGNAFKNLGKVLKKVNAQQDELLAGVRWNNVVSQGLGEVDAAGQGPVRVHREAGRTGSTWRRVQLPPRHPGHDRMQSDRCADPELPRPQPQCDPAAATGHADGILP